MTATCANGPFLPGPLASRSVHRAKVACSICSRRTMLLVRRVSYRCPEPCHHAPRVPFTLPDSRRYDRADGDQPRNHRGSNAGLNWRNAVLSTIHNPYPRPRASVRLPRPVTSMWGYRVYQNTDVMREPPIPVLCRQIGHSGRNRPHTGPGPNKTGLGARKVKPRAPDLSQQQNTLTGRTVRVFQTSPQPLTEAGQFN